MEICPNKSFKSNPEQEKSDWELLIDRVGSEDNAWNEYILNGFDIPIFNEEQVIKEGVQELFVSNPELANAVYEALGFKTKTSENEITRGIKEILPFKVIGDYSNIEEGLTGRRQYSTAIDGNNYVFDISTYSYENEDGTFQSYYDIDFTVNGSEDIIGTGFFDKSEKAKQIIQAIISQNYGNDTIRLNVEESKKGKQRLLLYKRLMNQLGYNPSEEMEYTLFYDIKTDKVNLTPQQKQQAQQLYSRYLESLNKPNTNPILQGNQTNIEEIITQLEKDGLLEIDCKGKLKAEKGLATSFVKGGKWKVIKDLKGYPTHKEGGVDLIIGKNGVIIKNGNTQFTAKHGLVIPKAQDGIVYPNGTKVKVNQNNQIKEYDISSPEYKDLYNSGKLMSYDKNSDTYIATPLKEVVITAEAPQWLKYKKEYEKTNPKSNYINQYLTPFAKSLGNTETNYPKRLDDEYDNNLYSSYLDKLHNDFSFEFSDKEQELVDKYSKTERDKSAYKYFKGKSQDKKWQDEYIKATKDITFDTFTDQLPDIAKKYQGNPYIDKILKLPHINKIKAGYQFLYEGRPLTAISELVKIPKFSSITTDALMNIMQDNPEGYDLKNIEDKYLSPVRLASIKNDQIISDIGREIIRSGETKNSSWKSREYNLPDLTTASKAFSKKYNTDQNDFVEFIENYMVGRKKSYKQTLAAYEKYLQTQQNKSKQ